MINIFITNDIISPYAQHKTVRLYNESMKKAIRENTITEPQEKLFEQIKQEKFENHIRKSNLHYSFGEEIQMLLLFGFGLVMIKALHLAVDKVTGKVLADYFDYEETTKAYLTVFMNLAMNFGISKRIKTAWKSKGIIRSCDREKHAGDV